jgi:molybdopterin molybdotransferase
MLSVEQAQQRILERIHRLEAEVVPTVEAGGRVLAASVSAPFDIPPYDNSAMDGFAVLAADTAGASEATPVTLPVVETVAAGHVASRPLESGQAMRIMTGAPLPEGADAVIVVERTRPAGESVELLFEARHGAHIRRRGEDVRQGEVVLEAGSVLAAGELGLLASMRQASVTVARQPRVAVISTGDELVEIDAVPGPGQIVNSNSYSIAELVRECGGLPERFPIVSDRPEAIVAALRAAEGHDVVVTTGGVSVGEFDYVKQVLDEVGARQEFWRVSMKPGKPVLFATMAERPFFGLPGNPVSCMVAFHLFVAPALRKMEGLPDERLLATTVTARLDNDVRSTGDRRNYLRGVLRWVDDGFRIRTRPAQGSGVLSSMTGANGLAVVPEGTRFVGAGEAVSVVVIGRV